jgi:alpha-1,6-mannosyltransferase
MAVRLRENAAGATRTPSATTRRTVPASLRYIVSLPNVRLALAGVALLSVLAALLVAPLSIPANPRVLSEPDPLVTILGGGWFGALRFIAPVLAVFALYIVALRVACRSGGRAATVVVLAGTALLLLALLPLNTVTAGDVLHNVADARTFWWHAQDPSIYPPSAFPHDAFLRNVPAWRSTPSAYGPVWYALSGLPLPFAGNDVWANVIGQKLIVSAFLFGSVLLTMQLARRAGANPIVAGIFVGWNPLLLWEAAGNGHNDAVTVFFALAALLAASRRRAWPAVFPLLALAIASKPVLAILGPPLLIWLMRQPDTSRSRILLSLLLGGGVLVACYAPLWQGSDTIVSLARESQHVSSSPGALVHTLIWEATGWDGIRILADMRLVAVPLFLAAYAALLWRLPDTDLSALLSTCCWAIFLLLTVLLWWFMPWYLTWLVPLAAPLALRQRAVAIAFSAGALLLYAPHMWLLNAQPVALAAAVAAVAFLPPLVVLIVIGRERAARAAPVALAAAAD